MSFMDSSVKKALSDWKKQRKKAENIPVFISSISLVAWSKLAF